VSVICLPPRPNEAPETKFYSLTDEDASPVARDATYELLRERLAERLEAERLAVDRVERVLVSGIGRRLA
jgi:hypothetical protein